MSEPFACPVLPPQTTRYSPRLARQLSGPHLMQYPDLMQHEGKTRLSTGFDAPGAHAD